MLYDTYDRTWGPTTRPDYGRHPYIWITLPDGRQFEGRATGWTEDKIHAKWADHDAPPRKIAWMTTHMQSAWMDAEHVTRISRREATQPDPYDDYQWFSKQGEI